MVKGFCSTGPLVSPDIAAIIPEIVSLFQNSHKLGIKHFLLFQDTHHPETPEFTSYPPHCLKGSGESETIDEIAGLPFAGRFTVFEKNSISPAYQTGFDDWLKKHPAINTIIQLRLLMQTENCLEHIGKFIFRMTRSSMKNIILRGEKQDIEFTGPNTPLSPYSSVTTSGFRKRRGWRR